MDPIELDPLDVEAHVEPEGVAQGEPTAGQPAGGGTAAAEPEVAGGPAVPNVSDPADASLLALIYRLSSLLERTELTELEVQVGETGLVLRKPSAMAPTVAVAAAPAPAVAPAPGASAPTDAAATNGAAPAEAGLPARPSVKAPLTGIWYGSPAPGSAPFVSQGGEVNTGQVIGLIEAMKLFNEIKSDLAGRVVRVHAEDGKLVKAKQPLIEVEPL
jgi:acetyl-CoA carboxylase biotin carboxyl carrier protein